MTDFDCQNWKEWNFRFKVAVTNAWRHVCLFVTKMEVAECEDAMVEVATLEALSLTDGDLDRW